MKSHRYGFGLLTLALFILVLSLPAYAQKGSHPGRAAKGVVYDYDGEGVIDRIDDQEIVIDDTGFRLATRVEYRDAQERWTSPAYFAVGSRVGFRLNDAGEIQTLCIPPTDR